MPAAPRSHRNYVEPQLRGRLKIYRPRPADFREIFIRLGWGDIEDHYRANCYTVRRWMDEVGRDELIADRAAYVANRLHHQNMKLYRYRMRVKAGLVEMPPPSPLWDSDAAQFYVDDLLAP